MFQMKASNNYLALRSVDGTYYINGDWRIDFPNDYEAAGTIAHYERIIKGRGFFFALSCESEILLPLKNMSVYL